MRLRLAIAITTVKTRRRTALIAKPNDQKSAERTRRVLVASSMAGKAITIGARRTRGNPRVISVRLNSEGALAFEMAADAKIDANRPTNSVEV
jgi:hypothetical protein